MCWGLRACNGAWSYEQNVLGLSYYKLLARFVGFLGLSLGDLRNIFFSVTRRRIQKYLGRFMNAIAYDFLNFGKILYLLLVRTFFSHASWVSIIGPWVSIALILCHTQSVRTVHRAGARRYLNGGCRIDYRSRFFRWRLIYHRLTSWHSSCARTPRWSSWFFGQISTELVSLDAIVW